MVFTAFWGGWGALKILKTTPIPNKLVHMAWKSGFVCHKGMWKSLSFAEERDLYAICSLILWHILGIFFAHMGGGPVEIVVTHMLALHGCKGDIHRGIGRNLLKVKKKGKFWAFSGSYFQGIFKDVFRRRRGISGCFQLVLRVFLPIPFLDDPYPLN